MQQMIAKMGKGQYPSINETDIKTLRIPVPPIPVQEQIVAECEKIDTKYNSMRMSIEEYRRRIEMLFSELESIPQMQRESKFTLSDKDSFAISIVSVCLIPSW